jgi:hypothetical protein
MKMFVSSMNLKSDGKQDGTRYGLDDSQAVGMELTMESRLKSQVMS